MRVCFDLDGVICTGTPYEEAKLIPGMKELVCSLKENGHTIIINTARGMGSLKGDTVLATLRWQDLTINQLRNWGIPYDEIYFGKPAADAYVDDKGIAAGDVGLVSSILDHLDSTQKSCHSSSRELDSKLFGLLGKANAILAR